MSDGRVKAPLAKVEPVATAASANPAGATTAAAPAAAEASKDIVLLGPPTADGAGVHVLRAREERIEAGELRGIQEGRPITGEIVTLQPRKDNPHICDVTQSYAPPAAALGQRGQRGHKGPANVATGAYRDGWDAIFGAKDPSSKGLN